MCALARATAASAPRGSDSWPWSLVKPTPCMRSVRGWRGTVSARQKQWARTVRAALILWLGGRCRACGSSDSLTFNCRTPTGADHHAMDSSARMCYYRKQARQGNLSLLCGYCNSIKRNITHADWETALLFVVNSAAIMLLTGIPGQGNRMTAPERRECLREAISRIRADRAAQARIKTDI
jgi:hypothetical protein